jgi:hypothetical protein
LHPASRSEINATHKRKRRNNDIIISPYFKIRIDQCNKKHIPQLGYSQEWVGDYGLADQRDSLDWMITVLYRSARTFGCGLAGLTPHD